MVSSFKFQGGSRHRGDSQTKQKTHNHSRTKHTNKNHTFLNNNKKKTSKKLQTHLKTRTTKHNRKLKNHTSKNTTDDTTNNTTEITTKHTTNNTTKHTTQHTSQTTTKDDTKSRTGDKQHLKQKINNQKKAKVIFREGGRRRNTITFRYSLLQSQKLVNGRLMHRSLAFGKVRVADGALSLDKFGLVTAVEMVVQLRFVGTCGC